MRNTALKLYFSEVSVSLKQLARNIALVVAAVLSLAYCAYSFFSFAGYGDPFVLVYRTRYTQFVVHLLAIIIGLLVGGSAASARFDEISESIARAALPSTLSLVTVVLIAESLYFCAYIFIFMLFLNALSVTAAVYVHCLNYMLLYVWVPSLTLGLIGAAVSVQVSSNFKYFAAFMLWLFLSPVICVAGKYLFSFLNITGEKIYYLIHILNQGDMIFKDNPSSYTLHTDEARYAFRLAFLMLSLAAVFLISLARKQGKSRAAINCALLIVPVVVILLTASPARVRYYTSYIMNSPAFATSEDAEYYWKIARPDLKASFDRASALPDYESGVRLEPVSCDIKIDLELMGAEFYLTNRYTAKDYCADQTFTLYRGFEVREVRVNGEAAAFDRGGDYLSLAFPKELAPDEEVEIVFSYGGLSSAAFPASKNLVSLWGSYPYMPRVGYAKPPEHSLVGMGGYAALPLYAAQEDVGEVRYVLRMDTPYTAYCNLEDMGNGAWEGVSKDGVSIVVSPLLKKVSRGGYDVYASELVISRADELVSLYERFEAARGNYFAALGLESRQNESAGKDLVLWPTSPGVIGISVFYRMDDFVAVYQGSAAELNMVLDDAKNADSTDQLIWNEMNEHPLICAPQARDFFNAYVLDSMKRTLEGASPNSDIGYLLGYYRAEGIDTAAQEEAARKLAAIMASEDKERARAFYGNWFRACMNGEEMDIAHITELLDAAAEGTRYES